MRNEVKKLSILMALLIGLLSCGTFVGNPESDDDGDETNSSTEQSEVAPEDKPDVLNGPDYVVDPNTSAGFLLTDAPIDGLSEVVVKFSRLGAKRSDGKWVYVTFSDYAPVNLLSLQDGVTKDLSAGLELSEGDYSELRLMLDSSFSPYVKKENSEDQISLEVPSGEASGIKIKIDFSVLAGETNKIVLDFDVRQSLKFKGAANGMKLAPKESKKSENLNAAKPDTSYRLSPVVRATKLKSAHEFKVASPSVDFEGIACLYVADYAGDLMSTTEECNGSLSSDKISAGMDEAHFHFIEYGEYKVVFVSDESVTISEVTFTE